MEESYLSVVLLPNEVDVRALVACAEAVCTGREAVIKAGGNSLPHITIGQFPASVDEAADLWGEVQACEGMVTNLLSGGLLFTPNTTVDKTWVMLQFLRSGRLEALQQAVIATSFAQSHALENKIADAYNPHCTLALLEGAYLPALDLTSFALFRREFSALKLAIGQNGPHMSLTKVLYQ